MRGHGTAARLMAAPAILGLLAFVGLPFLLSVGFSLTDMRLGSPLPVHFVGWHQYRRLFHEAAFQHALLNNVIFAALVVPLQTAAALLVAWLLNRPQPGQTFFRAMFFLPVIFPMSLVAVIWQLVYGPGPDGPLNRVLVWVTGGRWEPVDFLHHPQLALAALMLLSMWQGLGLQMVILLAALQNIPRSLLEAAQMDGAGPWASFRYVTLPQLRNPLIFTALMTTILAFRVFDQVHILTRGGPLHATTTLMYLIVSTSFERLQVGKASALTVVFFLVVVTLTGLQRWLTERDEA